MKINQFVRPIICIGILILCSFSLYGQGASKENKNPYANLPFKERVFAGGSLGLSFGTITSIYLAPTVGYNISPKFSTGLGPIYQYYKDTRFPDSETSVYGGSVFGRYYPLDMIFLQTEFQVLNLEAIDYNFNSDQIRNRVTIPVLFVGGGYSQRNAKGSGVYIGILYDLIGDINSPYPNNINFMIGGSFGF